MRSRLTFAVVFLASLPLTGRAPQPKADPGGLCCLCMCHSADENQCASVCVRMQHSKRIIEEPEMNACTKSCARQGVKQIHFVESEDSQ